MALRLYRHRETGEEKRSFQKLHPVFWEEVITAPDSKMMERADPSSGKSKLKGATPILTERARSHSRDVEIDDQIAFNKDNGLEAQVTMNLLNEKGERRRKIDDV